MYRPAPAKVVELRALQGAGQVPGPGPGVRAPRQRAGRGQGGGGRRHRQHRPGWHAGLLGDPEDWGVVGPGGAVGTTWVPPAAEEDWRDSSV